MAGAGSATWDDILKNNPGKIRKVGMEKADTKQLSEIIKRNTEFFLISSVTCFINYINTFNKS